MASATNTSNTDFTGDGSCAWEPPRSTCGSRKAYVTISIPRTRRSRIRTDTTINTRMAMLAAGTESVDWPRTRKIALARTSSVSCGEIKAQERLLVIVRSAWYMAEVKKMMPAYMIATNRRLFEIDDNARSADAETSVWIIEKSVIAGMRNRLARRKVALPAKTICRSNSIMAGRKVTPIRKTTIAISLPATYSTRVSGLDKYSCSALARRSSAIRPAREIDTRNTKID